MRHVIIQIGGVPVTHAIHVSPRRRAESQDVSLPPIRKVMAAPLPFFCETGYFVLHEPLAGQIPLCKAVKRVALGLCGQHFLFKGRARFRRKLVGGNVSCVFAKGLKVVVPGCQVLSGYPEEQVPTGSEPVVSAFFKGYAGLSRVMESPKPF